MLLELLSSVSFCESVQTFCFNELIRICEHLVDMNIKTV